MSFESFDTQMRHPFQTDDLNLLPIAAKVAQGERLSFEDGVTLYRSGDILAVGWLANLVRERLHGNIAYFNVNRHINPTNVCVASCRLCAFGRKKGDAGTYTMALEEAWETAGTGLSVALSGVSFNSRTSATMSAGLRVGDDHAAQGDEHRLGRSEAGAPCPVTYPSVTAPGPGGSPGPASAAPRACTAAGA